MRKSCHVRVRRFEESDAEEVSALIARTLRTTNRKDYTEAYIENDVRTLTPAYLIKRSAWTHFYVFCADGRIVGCGAIGPYWDKENESSLFKSLFCRNTRAWESAEKLWKRWRGTSIFCAPNA